MDETEGACSRTKGSMRPMCPKCRQVLSARYASRCVWCGALLPKELQLSEDEKANMLNHQKQKLASREAERTRKETGASHRSLFGV